MNERIKQLAQQAGFYVDDKIYIPSTSEEITECQKKFAELLVKECCQFENSYGGDAGLVARSYSRKIKEHFGVGE